MGQTQQALADCSRATELRPNMAYAYCIRGTIYRQAGKYQQARDDYSRVLALSAGEAPRIRPTASAAGNSVASPVLSSGR